MRIQLIVAVVLVVLVAGCTTGDKTPEYNVNLLSNASFETVGEDGLPTGWELTLFRGGTDDVSARYEVDNRTSSAGDNSFGFSADPDAKRFYMLTQEVEVPLGTEKVRLRGWMQLEGVNRGREQYAQCNFLLTFYDENHNRFQEMRAADKRTKLKVGSILWYEENREFRLPQGTRYVAVSCVLGMSGRVWFDDVSLVIPEPLPWEIRETENYVFHWLTERSFPAGAIDNQQRIFDQYKETMGVTGDMKIKYFLYPDTAAIREKLSIRGFQYVSWDDREFHSINPNDDHEVVHFLTDPLGVPPRSIAEGTAIYLVGNWDGHPIRDYAAALAAQGQLPTVNDLVSYNLFARLQPNVGYPASAAFVEYLVERFGWERLMTLYRGVNGINSYDFFVTEFEKIYPIEVTKLEDDWRNHLLDHAREMSKRDG